MSSLLSKETVQTHLSDLGHTTSTALTSKTYIYPPLGTLYLLRHASLYPPIIKLVLPCIFLTFFILIPLFTLTYLPQAAVLTILNGPMGPINAILLVCSEGSMIVNLIARAWLIKGAEWDLFDATLLCVAEHEQGENGKALEGLVRKGREVRPKNEKREGAKRLGRMLMAPISKFAPGTLITYLALLPLNLIPIVGTPIFLILQGRNTGPSFHERYFQLKGLDSEDQKKTWIQERRGAYVAFGTAATAMNLIPFTSLFFTFTSTVGAALWAVEIERGIKATEVLGAMDARGKKKKE